MNLKKVTTNYETFYTDASDKTIKEWMYEYIKRMRERGHSLEFIKFVYGRVKFSHHAMTIPFRLP